jgi:hypothetical protein
MPAQILIQPITLQPENEPVGFCLRSCSMATDRNFSLNKVITLPVTALKEMLNIFLIL